MSHPVTATLVQTPLFRLQTEGLPLNRRVQLSYERAQAIVQAYNLTREDVLNVSAKYWEFHTDPILVMDGSVGTLLTIHYNLCAGTLAKFSEQSPEIAQTLSDILTFRLSGQFCLTELGHGLDAINLETTATLLPDGGFELSTPTEQAAKFMPPTTPCGIPCVSIVFARLIANGEDRGVKPFVVPLHDGGQMYPGIVSKTLSTRGGSQPVNHALTYFNRVRLPRWALLGDLLKAKNPRMAFFDSISRVISGTLSMGAFGLSAMRIGSYVAARYSLRRCVTDGATGLQRPIISFSTQYIPVLVATSQTLVMRAFAREAHSRFVDPEAALTTKHFTAAIFKATVMKLTQNMLLSVGDRCGAQGLFEVNQLSVLHADMRGASIAEGDILGISIRFAIELLLGRIFAPVSLNPDSILAQHEASLITELRGIMSQSSGHRDNRLESVLLPQCQALIEGVGHRLAYDAAVQHGVDKDVIDLYVASIMAVDPAWYVEHAGLSRSAQKMRLFEGAALLYPQLEQLLRLLEAENYITAPMVSDSSWDEYVRTLEAFGGEPSVRNIQTKARL